MDIKFIKENTQEMKKVCENKNIDPKNIDRVLGLDEKRRKLIHQKETLRAEQNKLGKDDIAKARELKEKQKPISDELDKVEKEYEELMLSLPNVYSKDTPVGKDESFNKEVYRWGDVKKFKKSHIELGKELDLIDFEKGVQTSGFRGYYLKNEAVLIHFALLWHALLKMVKKGFSPMFPPTLLREFALIGSGHFPFGREEVYKIKSEDVYLAGTSEPSLLAYFKDELFEEKDLPKKVCGFSQCYRSEVGSYGKDTKGLYRVHEFMKVEQVVLCKNSVEESNKWLEKMRGYSEEIIKELKIPYRVLQICAGDMGAGKYKMYDIEMWMPSRAGYGETHSDSNLTDWQSRRLNIKYKAGKEKKYVHALNNTVLASPRILIALLENYQKKDGSIGIPKVLRKYLPFKEIKRK